MSCRHGVRSIFTAVVASSLVLSAGTAGVPACQAQNASTGAIAGTVSDTSGAVLPDAQITVINTASSEKRTVITRARGDYAVAFLPPGTYTVVVSKENFKEAVYRNVVVNVTETEPINVQLPVGARTEMITVQASAEELQTQSSALGRTTNGEMIQNLPLAVRNFTQIVALNPNVATEVTRADSLGRGNGGFSNAFVSGGTRGSDNNFQMDGVDANDRQSSGNFSGGASIPNPDSIQEFKVQTSQYDATYGRSAGANVNVITKGGSNEFHGNVWEYFRNTVLNANDWFLNAAGKPRAVLNQNTFGFVLGGPIKRNKLLFFTSYQGIRQRNGLAPQCKGTIQGLTGLTNNNRTGAGLGAAFAGQHGSAGSQAADTIQANGSNISPQAVAILNEKINGQFLIPSAQGLVTLSEPCPYNEDHFVGDVDYIQSDKSRFSGRFFFANSFLSQTLPSPNSVLNVPLPLTQDFRNFSLTHNYVLAARLLNEAAVGFHRTYTNAPASSPFSYSSIGASVPSFDNDNPNIMIPGAFTIPGAPGGGVSTLIAQNTYDVRDALSYQTGKHFLRFGAGLTRVQLNRAVSAGTALQFNSFADFLLGLPAGPGGNGGPVSNIFASVDQPGLYTRALRIWDANAYLQDDIKITSHVTVNLGFRYDREGDMADALGRNIGFDPSLITPYSTPPSSGSLLGFLVSSNYPGTVPSGVTQLGNEYGMKGEGQNTWNPRLGFAWQLPHTDRLVLRGGYGIYHSTLVGQPQLNTTQGQPFAVIRQLSGLQNATASWARPFQPFTGTVPSFIPYTAATQFSVVTFDPNYRPPMIQQYSLNIQTRLAASWVLEIGYAGARGLHITDQRSVNEACVVGAPLSSDGCPSSLGVGTNTTANVQQRVPYEGFAPTGISQIQSQGAYWYNALESSLTKTFSHGLQLQASYTFAKELDTFAGTTTGGFNGGVPVGDQNHPLYGPDSFIRPQRLVVSYLYQLPGPKTSWLGEIFGGWQWSGVTTYQAGQFLTLTAANPNNIYGINSGQDGLGLAGASTASLASGCSIGQLVNPGPVESKLGINGGVTYFNLNCVARPAVSPYASPQAPLTPGACGAATTCPQATGFGNLGVGVVRGPDQANWDMALSKRFPAHWPNETANVEFRTDFFNAFNHPQFANPSTALPPAGGLNTLGQITSTSVNPRIIQFALRLNF
jgi:Carboxypeptidase regulatory-like domain